MPVILPLLIKYMILIVIVVKKHKTQNTKTTTITTNNKQTTEKIPPPTTTTKTHFKFISTKFCSGQIKIANMNKTNRYYQQP